MTARIRLCGRFEVELGGERIEHRLPGRQGPLVVAVLAVAGERPVPRDELMGVLWPERPPADPDEALSALLSKVRQAVGRDVLSGRRELTLALPDGAEIDVEQARSGAEQARMAIDRDQPAAAWEAASAVVAITSRGFLPGHDNPWVHDVRGDVADLRLRALEVQAQAGLALGGAHADGAERAAVELVREAPLREAGHRLLMEALAARGEVAEALAAYERLRVLLRDELGTAPGEAARALHGRLLTGDAPAPATSVSPHPAPGRLPDRLAQSLVSTWVGRHAALRRLRERAERVVAGETELVFVTGEGGIGKTRLVAELANRLSGFEVLYGRCDEEELFPFGPWVDMLRPRLAGMGEPELAELVRGAPELARLLPEIHNRLPELGGLPAGGDPETQRRQMFGAVVTVVRRLASQGPVLMVVDDVHWADRSSLLLARHLAQEPRLGAVLMVCTFRDSELQPGHPLRAVLAELERGRELPRVRLRGMDEREVGQLVGDDVAPGTVATIHAETAGNPFFVKQLVRHLEESGDTGGVPDGVRDVIARRVARLSEHAGRVLGIAALIGRDFDLDLLERVAGLTEEELLDVLDAAVRGALLVEVHGTPGRYSFAHALLRTTLEAELSATRRARLHLRIGEAIEQLHGTRPDRWLAELARHFGAAGPRAADRAVAYAERAAEQAASRLAYDETVRLLAAAVRVRRGDEHADPTEVARLENALAAAEADAGHWEAARASFARATVAARAAGAGAADAFARAALGHAGGTWEQYAVEDAENVALLEEALGLLPAEDSAMRAQVLARIAVHRSFVAHVREPELRAIADEAVAMARRVGEAQPLAAALTGALHARWRPGRAADRLELATELIELTEAHNQPTCAADAHIWRAQALLELCRLDEADAHLARHAELAEASQQPALLIHRDAVRSMRATLEGDYEHGALIAREMFDRGEREQADGRLLSPIHAQFHGTTMLSLRNERGELGPHAPFFEGLARQVAPPGWLPALAWARAQAGRPELARELIEAMSDAGFATMPRDSLFIPRLAQVAHVVAELGDAKLADRVEPLLAPFGEFWVVLGPAACTLGPVAYSVGALQLLQNRPETAASSFELALERSRAMRARPYVTRAQAGLAAALRRLGDDARADALAGEAAATARELGMLRVQRELGALSLS